MGLGPGALEILARRDAQQPALGRRDDRPAQILFGELPGHGLGRVVRTEVQTSVSDDNWIEVVKRRSPDPGDDDRWELIDGSEQVILGDPLSHTKP